MRPTSTHLIALALAGLTAACSLPEGDQASARGAHDRLLGVRASGDLQGQWALLHPDVKAQFQRWLGAEKTAAREIELAYPAASREAALKAMAGGKRAALSGPRDLFGTLVATTEAEPLAPLELLGSRVLLDLDDAPDRAELLTLGGQRFLYRQGADGTWFAWPSDEEHSSLTEAVRMAEANQKTVAKNAKMLTRGTAPAPTP